MITIDDFKKLRSWGWRNKGVRQKWGPVRALWNKGTTRGAVDVDYDPKFHTGCWSYDGYRHRIKIGGRFTEALTSASQSNPAHVRDASQSLLRHECWHGFATTQLKECVEELRKLAIPFRLFNVFEDARIEHLARIESTDIDEAGKFRWSNWLEVPVGHVRAIDWFHLLVHREASAFTTLTSAESGYDWLGDTKLADGRDVRRVIRKFYTRAIAADKSIDLIPILKEWVELFGVDTHKGLVPAEIAGEVDAEGKEEAKAEGTPEGYNPNESFDPKADDGITDDLKDELRHWSRGVRLNWDEPKVTRIVNRLTQIAASAAIDRDELGSTGSRIHIAGLINCSSQFTRCLTEVSGQREITVLVDCSSSMNFTWKSHGGLEFIIALARLHRRGILKVNCWLSGEGNWKVPFLKLSDKDIARIEPRFGREGFASTLRAAEKDILASDVTIGWTDGKITDGDVDVKPLRRKGVDIIGCAPRNPEDDKIRENIVRHFGKGYLGEAEQLARHIAHYIVTRD